MYLLHTLRAFADMPIASIVSPTESQVSAQELLRFEFGKNMLHGA